MSDRRNILELFEAQKDFVEEKISSGIEQHRKGNGGFILEFNKTYRIMADSVFPLNA